MSNLTRDEKRILIAEASGWKFIADVGFYYLTGYRTHLEGNSPDDQSLPVPDYFGSLDAMHDAISAIPPDRKSVFISRLADVLIEAGGRNLSTFDYVNAKPEQLPEAFGRALNLW